LVYSTETIISINMTVQQNGDITIRKGNSEILSFSSTEIGDFTTHTWTCNVRTSGSNTTIFSATVTAVSATSGTVTMSAANTALLTVGTKYEYVLHYVNGSTAKTLLCQNVTVLEGL